jgi:hypothetical protein
MRIQPVNLMTIDLVEVQHSPPHVVDGELEELLLRMPFALHCPKGA